MLRTLAKSVTLTFLQATSKDSIIRVILSGHINHKDLTQLPFNLLNIKKKLIKIHLQLGYILKKKEKKLYCYSKFILKLKYTKKCTVVSSFSPVV